MPSSDTTMHPISAPILLPGTQQAPTTPPELVSHLKSTTSSASTTGSNDGADDLAIHSKSSLPPMTTLSRTATRATSTSPTTPKSPPSPNNSNNSYRHHQDLNQNSGLRRFPSLGNTKKLSQENSTLRAKIVELERYLTGLKEELILSHRQIHGQKLDLKNLGENHFKELEDMKTVVQTCEFEMGVKVLEVEDMKAKIEESEREVEEKDQEIEELKRDLKAAEKNNRGERRRADSPVNRVVDFMRKSDDEVQGELVLALETENAKKEAQIQDLIQKLDRIGTEVLSLERERAQWLSSTAATCTAAPVTRAMTLENLVPITAETIIQSTTPSRSGIVVSSSDDSFRTGSSCVTTVNSVGYDLSTEHQRLLTKFRALSMQHAQASEYVDSLESENRDLKVQLLDVGGSML